MANYRRKITEKMQKLFHGHGGLALHFNAEHTLRESDEYAYSIPHLYATLVP